MAAAITPGASFLNAWRAIGRDARHHRSPNAGFPEAAMAGALGLALAGPRVYAGLRSMMPSWETGAARRHPRISTPRLISISLLIPS